MGIVRCQMMIWKTKLMLIVYIKYIHNTVNACIKIRLIDVDLFPWLAAPPLDYVIMS